MSTQPRHQLDSRDLRVGIVIWVQGKVGWPATGIEAGYQALGSDLSATVSWSWFVYVGWIAALCIIFIALI